MIEIYQVDAFADRPFTGNPAGVCLLENDIDEKTMQNIAMEMAVSETAFLSLTTMRLRWFSPKVEVELCGHGTLATAAVLQHKNLLNKNQTIQFDTMSGPISVRAGHDVIDMTFPVIPVEATAIDPVKAQYLGINEKDVLFWGKAGEKDFVHIKDEQCIREMKPHFDGLRSLPGRAAIVTSESSLSDYDFISRNFAPWVGVNEDPVTGSTHCALAHYWQKILKKSIMTAFQASKRGGVVKMELLADNHIQVSGKAIITLEGILRI